MNFYKKIIVAACAVIVAAIIGAAAYYLNNSTTDSEFVFPDNFKIENVSIGGLSGAKARKKLSKYITAVPKRISLRVSSSNGTYAFTQSNFRFVIDYTATVERAKDFSLGNPFGTEGELVYRVQPQSVNDTVKTLAKKVERKPINAEVVRFRPFKKNRLVIKNEENGLKIDKKDLINKLISAIDRGENTEITVSETILTPKIKKSDYKSIKKLSSQKSYSYNTINGTENMRIALRSCNGSIIKPGRVWSFNQCTGNSNSEKNGYKKAEVILRKKLTRGVGGGICQASTTIFRAAVLGNLEIEERHNHHWASGYTYSGEDATIDYPNLDLKLRNRSKLPVFIESRLVGRTLEVNIYGAKSENYDIIKMCSKNYDIKYGQSFRTKTIRVFYKRKKAVKKEVVCYSFYSLSDNHGVRAEDEGTFSVRKTVSKRKNN